MGDTDLADAVYDHVGHLNVLLAENLAAFGDPDVYVRAAVRDHAANLYLQLVLKVDNDMVRQTFQLAADACKAEAAHIRFTHGIPTPWPRKEHRLLGFGSCANCGRRWSPDATTTPGNRCEHCPKLLQGPTPSSEEEAATLPKGTPVDTSTWRAPDYECE